MITRNHSTDKPQIRTNFRIILTTGEQEKHTAHYCTSHEMAHGNGFAFWRTGDDVPACTAFFARESVASITSI